MKSWYKSLNLFYKVALVSTISLFVVFALTSVCYAFNYGEIPTGFAVGMGVGILTYFVTGLLDNKNEPNYGWVISMNIIRLFLLAGLIWLFAWLYYQQNCHVVNVFTLVGGYLIPLLVFIVIYIRNKKEEN